MYISYIYNVTYNIYFKLKEQEIQLTLQDFLPGQIGRKIFFLSIVSIHHMAIAISQFAFQYQFNQPFLFLIHGVLFSSHPQSLLCLHSCPYPLPSAPATCCCFRHCGWPAHHFPKIFPH